ncbi:MAG: DUF721 domain-containing protein [bacterium]|nr:DUF721 domain-containing protein [bacterium]MCY3925539.1 DUF721 domain-containing protein [bacterium]
MSGPRHVADGLNRLLGSLGAPPADVLAALIERWPRLAGEGLAEHSRPVRIVNRRLLVEVDDPARAAQLRLGEGALLERLAAALGEGRVRSVRARVVRRPNRERPRRR